MMVMSFPLTSSSRFPTTPPHFSILISSSSRWLALLAKPSHYYPHQQKQTLLWTNFSRTCTPPQTRGFSTTRASSRWSNQMKKIWTDTRPNLGLFDFCGFLFLFFHKFLCLIGFFNICKINLIFLNTFISQCDSLRQRNAEPRIAELRRHTHADNP